MTANEGLKRGIYLYPVTVYPGMFTREVQATIKIAGQDVTIICSKDDVDVKEQPSEAGVKGNLSVYVVDINPNGVLIDLPGEPVGTTRRFRIPTEQFEMTLRSNK